MYIPAGRPAFARPCERVHWSTSLTSSSLRLQQCPACLVRVTWIVFVMGGRWPYSCCFVGCCFKDLLNIARSIIVLLPSSFFSSCVLSLIKVSIPENCAMDQSVVIISSCIFYEQCKYLSKN